MLYQKDITIQRNRFLLMLIVVVAAALVCLTILLLKGYNQKRNFNRMLEEKIKERTNELLVKEMLLSRRSADQDLRLEKLRVDMGTKLMTIEALCSTALSDERISAEAKDYLIRISAASSTVV